MDKKGIYLKLPSKDIENMKRLASKIPKLKQSHIIQNFLEGLDGMDPNCKILIFDEKHIKLIDKFAKAEPFENQYESLELRFESQNNRVTATGTYVKSFVEGQKK